MSIHFSAEPDTIDTIYRIILSANQLSIYGAVAAICDEFLGQPDNTGEPVVLEGQSIVLGEVKAEVPAQEEPEDSNIALRKYFQQVQRLSPEDRLSKFCKEAGFMSVVEVGQYFVTRNASEFLLKSVACREYTLPRDDPASEAKGWPGRWGPQGMSLTGGGLARVPNLRVCEHLYASRWHTQGGKDELTSCRGTV